MRTAPTLRRAGILTILLALATTLLAPPAHAHHGSSGSQSVTAADRTSLELVAEAYMLDAHNDQRRSGNSRNGVRHGDVGTAPALRAWTDVTTVARRWADALAWDNFRHNPDYSRQFGHWSAAGENIAITVIQPASHGTPSATQVRQAAEELMQGWWESDGHRRNWMGTAWDHVGLGAALTTMHVGGSEDHWVLTGTANFRRWDGSSVAGTSFPADGATPPNESSHGGGSVAGPTPGARFGDVPTSHPFHGSIEALAASGVTRGCDGDRFCPDDFVTRGQMAAFLTRALDLPAGATAFADTRGHVFERPVSALAGAGVTRGCGGDRFCPDDLVTRGQMAAFLTRALDLPAGTASFADTRSHLFRLPIAALATAGVTKGCGGDDFCPDAYVTRAQMAAFLDRAGVLG